MMWLSVGVVQVIIISINMIWLRAGVVQVIIMKCVNSCVLKL